MASDQSLVTFVCDQMSKAGDISHRKMFGEYAIYRGEKVVALVCDNQLFLKPTAAGKAGLKKVVEAPPYSGAKAHYLITDRLEDSDLLARVIVATAGELPEPKAKKPKAKRK